ncbi:MAG: glycosyltransferase family 4 protein [Alphaproteobacteria bacterium]
MLYKRRMSWPLTVGAFLAVLIAAGAGTAAACGWLRRRAILDHPNERSSHGVPTPRGGGIAMVPALLAGWAGLAVFGQPPASSPGLALWIVIGAALFLAGLSWVDDRRGLSPFPRLFAQAVAAGVGVAVLPADAPVFQGLLPPLLDRFAAWVAWVWFINLFNFMDGIDGLAGSEAACIGAGLALVLWAGNAAGTGGLAALALLVAAAALGFLWWNWHPARIFMGDVGSVPLGYLIGWLLLRAAADGAWVAALILPLYFLADATITLARRFAGGHMPWHAHRTHFYQRALLRGLGHADVVRRVVIANLALLALALVGDAGYPAYALGGAVAVVGLLLVSLGRGAKGTG